jgi:hexosaminidase
VLSRIATGFLFALTACAQSTLMPMPASITAGTGQLQVPQNFAVKLEGAADPRIERAVARIGATVSSRPPALIIRTTAASNPVQSLDENESYQLTVTPQQATLSAPNTLGTLHGLETFRQLIQNHTAPAVTIDDHPRFSWRGLHIDVSRHFMPIEVIKRNLDGMAAVKLNVFHWHLSDDQGFRVESKRFPKLQEQGSDGLFYTQDQIREVIAYARDRAIRVVPEFDIPGHATSWLVGYPELAAAPGPYQIIRTWGVFDPSLDPDKPEVYTFLDAFIGEMAALFPDAYFHIGGDEVKRKDLVAKQAGFNERIEQIVIKHGKRMEGWDEILNPALPKDIVIQSWRGAKSLTEAAHEGYQGILSSGYYLDHIEPASKLYLVDPLTGVTEGQQHILGGEVCMWAEYVSPETVDSRIWPRTAAIAERFWSPEIVRDIPDMYRRLALIDHELDALGLTQNTNYTKLLEHVAGSTNLTALKTLADVVEPGTLGLRHRVNPNYTQSTPLNRFVDAARPDPPAARHFADLVDDYLANKNDTAARNEIRQTLQTWIANDAKIPASLTDAKPVSTTLANLSRQAMASLNGKRPQHPVPQTQKPIGEVTLPVAVPLLKLIASAT